MLYICTFFLFFGRFYYCKDKRIAEIIEFFQYIGSEKCGNPHENISIGKISIGFSGSLRLVFKWI